MQSDFHFDIILLQYHVVTWKRRCLHSRDCGPGDCSGSLQAREMMEVCGRQRGDGDVNSHLTLITKVQFH